MDRVERRVGQRDGEWLAVAHAVPLDAERRAAGGPGQEFDRRVRVAGEHPAEIVAEADPQPSSSRPNSRLAFAQNSTDAPHQAGTRSGSWWAKALRTRSREVVIVPLRTT